MGHLLAWSAVLACALATTSLAAEQPATGPASTNANGAAVVSFARDIMPLMNKLGCNATECHGSLQGKGGLRLSLFGSDAQYDYEALTRWGGGRRINRVEPGRSLLVLKATGAVPHQGHQALKPGSSEHAMLISWIADGAPRSRPKEPQLVSIQVVPAQSVLQTNGTRQLTATAVFSDGSKREVTRWAAYRSSDRQVATVSGEGQVTAAGLGEAAVVVTYLRQSGVARVLVPQVLPGAFPQLERGTKVDELVDAKLTALGIPPSAACTDEEFVRRAYLDVIGTLPTAAEARAFLKGTNPDKRSKLIDQLLQRDEFADFWALKWGDLLRIKSEYPVRVWPKGVAAYHRWLRESIAANKPYDQFVRELLTSSGSSFRSGPANFFRAVPSKDAQTMAETTALVFMGARLGCARCHGHPLEGWTLEDNLGLGAFFAKVSFKNTSEWKEEIVYVDPKAVLRHPKTKAVVKPRFLGGPAPEIAPEEDPRVKFAEWLTDPKNPWFARNVANRVWFWLFGRGIVHEPDDLRPTNPPENPELLDYLAQELVGHGYDLKHLYRLALTSRTYQRSSQPNEWNAKDAAHFSHYPVRRLDAEQLLDAIGQVTETAEKFSSRIPEPFSYWPTDVRATQLSDGNVECSFLEMFGKPARDTPFEGERTTEISLRQALYFINSDQLEAKVSNSPRLQRLLQSGRGDGELIEEIFLSAVARFPTAGEKEKLLAFLGRDPKARAQALRDVTWAVLNTEEFLFKH